MQVILTKEVLGLGDPGQVVKVKAGYGRNYLIPQGMAIEATKHNVAHVEAEKKRLTAQMAREADKVKAEADKVSALDLKTKVKTGEGGKLYGSVTNMDIAKIMAEAGVEIDRRRIILEAPIKSVGSFDFKVKLHPQVVVDMSILVEGDFVAQPAKPKEPKPEAEAEAAEEAAVEAAAEEAVAEAAPDAAPDAAPEAAPEAEASAEEAVTEAAPEADKAGE